MNKFAIAVFGALLTASPVLALDAERHGPSTLPSIAITGSGSTGDVSGMSARPSGATQLRPLASRLDVQLEDYCPTVVLNASAGNITSCLQAAVDAAVARGRCLTIPQTPASAVYWSLTAALVIGDGSTSGSSTVGGHCIRGAGSAGIYGTRGSYLVWTGAAGGTMLDIRGPIENVKLSGLNFNGFNSAARLIKAQAVRFAEIRDVFGQGFTGQGVGFYGIRSPQSPATTHSNNIMLDLSGLYITSNQTGAIALDFDGVLLDENGNAQSNDTWLSSVRNSRFESTGTNGVGIRLAFSDNMLFTQIHSHVNKSVGGCAVKFDAMSSLNGGNSFPTGHMFVKSALDNTCTVEDAGHTIGVNNFIDYGTTDNETIPTHPKLRGITDQGFAFGGYGGPVCAAYSPTLTAGTPGATPPTFTGVTLSYCLSGKVLTVNGTFTVATRGTAAAGILVPLPSNLSAAGLQAITVNNASTGATWYGVTQGAYFKSALPSADGQIFVISASVSLP